MKSLVFTGDGRLPTRTHPTDAGFDLYTSEETVVWAGRFADVPCGIRVALPEHMFARIAGRSSTIRNRGLMVVDAVIDTGYRGPLFVGVWNVGDRKQTIGPGERIAQILLFRNEAPSWDPLRVDEHVFDSIPHDGRGHNGLGSSGS